MSEKPAGTLTRVKFPKAWFGGIYYLDRDGFSFNEGGGPLNFTFRSRDIAYFAIRIGYRRFFRIWKLLDRPRRPWVREVG